MAVCRLFTAVASLAVEHRLQGTWASIAVARGLSSCLPGAFDRKLNSQLNMGFDHYPK